MSHLMIPNNDIMLSSASDVDAICAPLRRLNITYFGYVKIYNDGSRFDINNDSVFSEAYYYKSNCHQLYAPETNPRIFENGFLFTSSGIIDQVKELQEISQTFSVGNLMLFMQKYSNYCDLWHFGALPSIPGMINIYLNNLDILKSFCFYFKEKGKHLIKQFEENRMRVKNKQSAIASEPQLLSDTCQTRSQCLHALKIDKYHLGESYNHHHLTKREVECIKWCIRGKTANETSLILDISKRTVNAHLDNAKRKLNCYKQSLLVRHVLDLGIIDAL
jgi:DNA-binding CsgD family transcriptional regulator